MFKMDKELEKHVLKTGTLTLGIVCKDGIVLAADNRITYGGDSGVAYIASTREKISKVTDTSIVTIAGVASDADKTIRQIRAEVKLKELKSKENIKIKELAYLFMNVVYHQIRTPSIIPSITHFLLTGYDQGGAHIYDIGPAGDIHKVETYQATGAPFEANAIFDSEYNKNITIEEGIKLAKKVFESTMGRQPGVGDGWDVYIIKDNSIEKVSGKKVVTELVDKE